MPFTPIDITGPPTSIISDDTGTAYGLALTEKPSERWASHFKNYDWTMSQAPADPVLVDDTIRFEWVEDEQVLFRMLDAIYAAVMEINSEVEREVGAEEREAARTAKAEAERERQRAAIFDRWWNHRGKEQAREIKEKLQRSFREQQQP